MKDGLLPPRPGEEPVKKEKEIKGIPINVYINGVPVSMDKTEALGVMVQIAQTLAYLNTFEEEENGETETESGGV